MFPSLFIMCDYFSKSYFTPISIRHQVMFTALCLVAKVGLAYLDAEVGWMSPFSSSVFSTSGIGCPSIKAVK